MSRAVTPSAAGGSRALLQHAGAAGGVVTGSGGVGAKSNSMATGVME